MGIGQRYGNMLHTRLFLPTYRGLTALIHRLIEKSNKNIVNMEEVLRNRLGKIGVDRAAIDEISAEIDEIKKKRDKHFKEMTSLEMERATLI